MNPPTLPQLGPVLDFMRAIWALDHALQRTSKHMEGQFGITGPQRLVVRILGRFPGLQAGQIAAILHVHPSTLSGVLKRLEKRGLIARRTDSRDRRRSSFGLTVAGRAIDVDTEGTVEAAVRETLGKLEATTVANAVVALGELTKALDLTIGSKQLAGN